MVKALILASLVALAGCQTTAGTFCSIAKPLRASTKTIDSMTDAEVRGMLGHNEKGKRLCGWRP